jgi:hypothetical protein
VGTTLIGTSSFCLFVICAGARRNSRHDELWLHRPGIGAISYRTGDLMFKQSCRSRSELPTSGLPKEHGWKAPAGPR